MFSLDFITEIFDCIKENDELCRVLISEHGDIDFVKKIIYIAHDRFVEDCRDFGATKTNCEYIMNTSPTDASAWSGAGRREDLKKTRRQWACSPPDFLQRIGMF
jgi:hypothetical protein